MKNFIFSTVVLFFISFMVNAQEHVITQKTSDAPPSEYPLGIYLMDSEDNNPYLYPVDGGVIFGFKPIHSNYRHTQFLARSNYFKIRTKNGNDDSWETWRTILMENQDGNVGIGTANPQGSLHIAGNAVNNGLILEGGASKIYTSTGGVDSNQPLRILNSPDLTSTAGLFAGGILVADNYSYATPGKNDLIVKGNVGVGTTDPTRKLQINALNSSAQIRLERTGNLSGITDFGTDSNGLKFWVGGYDGTADFFIGNTGNTGIGTTTPDSKLTVKGKIHAEEVKVDLSVPGPDYVFNDEYNLITLEALQNYIKTNGHLPNIPSAKKMEQEGIELSIMNMKLLEKIEELTLYILQQEKQLKTQRQGNKDLEKRLEKLEKLINPE